MTTSTDNYTPFAPGAPSTAVTSSHVSQLKQQTAGVRVLQEKFGFRKALSKFQCAEAAEPFGANGAFLSASKKLVDTNHPAYKAVTSILSQARRYWLSTTVPYPLPGIRLIRKDQVTVFDDAMVKFRADLNDAVKQLEDAYAQLREEAQERLGELFDPNDYPACVTGHYRLAWEYPTVEPPDFLKDLNPKIYAEMQARAEERLQEAVRMAEDAFTNELQEMVSHLVERLSGEDDGKPKIFRDSAVKNLTEFFGRFQSMNIGSNQQLSELVKTAEAIIGGVDVKDLRKEPNLREHVASKLGEVDKLLAAMVVDKPTRQISVEDLEE